MKFDEYFGLKDITIIPTTGCNLRCNYCVDGNTQITMSDLTTKSIKDIKVGDEVVSFNEFSELNKHRKLNTSNVVNVFQPRFVEKLYKIVMANGTELNITGEHPLLNGRNKWITPSHLYNNTKQKIKMVTLPHFNDINYIDNDFMLGYIISCFLGDGTYKKYNYIDKRTNKNCDHYRTRFVVKDVEINDRLKQYIDNFINTFTSINFKISNKYNIFVDGLYSSKEETYVKLCNLIDSNLNINTSENYYKGFLSGIYDCEGSYGKDKQLKISNGNKGVIEQIHKALKHFNIDYTFKPSKTMVNIQVYTFRILKSSVNKFLMNTFPACTRKRIKYNGYSPISNNNIKSIEEIDYNDYVYNIETSNHTYIANNILVHNCFGTNKDNVVMDKNDITLILDKCYKNYLTHKSDNFNFQVNFFGGEPFLQWDLIEYALKYSREKKYNISFGVTTNLTMLTDEMIDIIEEYELGILVSIDGIKEIHDRNRCNSYDIVKYNVSRLIDRGLSYLVEARMTMMPNDISTMIDSIKSIIDMGINNIAPVPVSDTEWTAADIILFEEELNKLWDYMIDLYNDETNKKNISIKCIEDFLENVLILDCDEWQTKPCSAGTKTSCSIGPNGDILPCHQRHIIKSNYDKLVIGNIKDNTDLKQVCFNDETIKSVFNCGECLAKSVCRGGCPSENITKNGDGNVMNEIQCMLFITQVKVALEKQENILLSSNIRSRRLNILKENMLILHYIYNDILLSSDQNELSYKLQSLYELLVDKENILLESYKRVINNIIKELVNIIYNIGE